MEKIEYHTPEEKKVCDWIHKKRERNRRTLIKKSIVIPLMEEDNHSLSACLRISFYKPTGKVHCAHSLKYKKHDFFPTTNNKLRCTNEHAKKQYLAGMAFYKNKCGELSKTRKRIDFYNRIEKHVYFCERVYYYPNGKICVVCGFNGNNGVKLKYIDEK